MEFARGLSSVGHFAGRHFVDGLKNGQVLLLPVTSFPNDVILTSIVFTKQASALGGFWYC